MTEHLHGLGRGLDVFGIDLSPQMVAVARQEHPGLRFEVGSMLALELPVASLGGLLAWYSTIHVPDRNCRAPSRSSTAYSPLAATYSWASRSATSRCG
ncbi:hypothetical protein GCM10010221_10910 [Streptomyces parvus]|nr:hypothetical protein GCM10010221_10910 [Streptomyces parvus]